MTTRQPKSNFLSVTPRPRSRAQVESNFLSVQYLLRFRFSIILALMDFRIPVPRSSLEANARPKAAASLAMLLVAALIVGCATSAKSPAPQIANSGFMLPPANKAWVYSDDGKLALRLSVIAPRVSMRQNIQVLAEIRNASQEKITVLRPFGDWYSAVAVGMKIWDGERQFRYAGPALTYVVGASAFAVIGPGEVVEDKLELTSNNFAGSERRARYTLRFDYAYNGYWDTTAAAGDSGIRNAWRGTISSREVQVLRE